MKLDWPIEIVGTGLGVPSNVVTNADWEKKLDTSDDWIVQRTGIRQRRIATPGESTLTFATAAARQAIQNADLSAADIDLIVNATITPEHVLPSTACELQAALGCRSIPAYDLVAACSGFVFALVNAAQNVQNGLARHALVLGAETMTSMVDLEDRATAVLFGDGAGAAVIRAAQTPQQRLIGAIMGVDGTRAKTLWVPAGGSAEPASTRTLNERLHAVRMQGREVYKFAVTRMHELIDETLDECGVALDDVDLIIPHQSNLRIIESACRKLGVKDDRVLINIDRYANTSAASIPIGLHEARRDGRIHSGDLVLFVAFGAGLSWGSALLRM